MAMSGLPNIDEAFLRYLILAVQSLLLKIFSRLVSRPLAFRIILLRVCVDIVSIIIPPLNSNPLGLAIDYSRVLGQKALSLNLMEILSRILLSNRLKARLQALIYIFRSNTFHTRFRDPPM